MSNYRLIKRTYPADGTIYFHVQQETSLGWSTISGGCFTRNEEELARQLLGVCRTTGADPIEEVLS